MRNKLKEILLFVSVFFIIVFIGTLISIPVGATTKISEKFNISEESIKSEQKVIYLTFDDGPSYKITNKVLDTLKENDVKATFFLIGNQIKGREDIIKRIYEEKHGIGLHTYTHKFRKIYSNEDKFIQEMIECQNEIQKVIGISPNIIRFPGGSYKHLSKNYLSKLHNNDFKIYDWNVETADGLNPNLSPYTLYRRAVKASNKYSNIILLMHCDCRQKNTCKALPQIIRYYKENGYEFKTITEDTPELYFPITRKTFNFTSIEAPIKD